VFRQKIMLDEEGDATQLAELLESTATRPGTLRRQLFSALSTSWMTGTAHDLLELLNTGGFVGYERLDPSGDDTTTTELLPAQPVEPAPELRFVLISDDGVEVPNDDLAVPLLEELARGGERLVLAAEPGEADEEGVFRAEFVSELRTRQSLAGLISTIDNVGTFIGRTAAVLAVADLGSGRLGHYGRGRGAETLVPPSPAE
jgi:hypothetical protein